MFEQNWSGRGHHAKFRKDERKLLDEILQIKDILGRTSTAVVESVKCKRILLARKTVFCNRNLTKEQAIDEVAHLTRLNHAHIVTVIGTYILGRELSILMYPVAEYNLDEFIRTLTETPAANELRQMKLSTDGFFSCLSSALDHVHHNLVKHMDIKPQNILVRQVRIPGSIFFLSGDGQLGVWYKVYLTDFGIARAYTQVQDVETEGPTSFTRKYATPEVANDEARGFPADIFSLGCVFLEICAALHDARWQFYNTSGRYSGMPCSSMPTAKDKDGMHSSACSSLQTLLTANPDGRPWYHANIDQLNEYFAGWLVNLGHEDRAYVYNVTYLQNMLSNDPQKRPKASHLVVHFENGHCCSKGREPMGAMPVD
jgi:serine/threonine protein kinase